MAILVTDPSLQQRLMAEREECGADRYDEVWEGITMMAPMPNDEHQQIVMLLASILQETVGWPGLGEVRPGVNLDKALQIAAVLEDAEIAGKLEMEYQVPDDKETDIVENLAKRAIKVVFDNYFKIEDLGAIVESFENGIKAEISQNLPSVAYMEGFQVIPGIKDAVRTLVNPENAPEASAAIEFILEGLHLSNKLNREVIKDRIVYK